jgi:glutaminyl-tRNA synthetase
MIVCLLMKLDSHKEKTFGIQNSNSGNCERLRRTKFSFQSSGDKFQFQRLGYFNTDKDSMPGKLVLIKQLD